VLAIAHDIFEILLDGVEGPFGSLSTGRRWRAVETAELSSSRARVASADRSGGPVENVARRGAERARRGPKIVG
jgi:hypothetical protein